MSKYVWCEDTGAGYEFWCKIFEVLDREIIVQSKKNNSELRKAVEQIHEDDNIYYIFMDMPMDNTDVLREAQRVNKIVATMDNVHTVRIHSFEFALLSFELLGEWVFAKEDSLKDKRENYLLAREIFLKMASEGIDNGERDKFWKLTKYDTNKNTEQLAASLIRDITRNTGFETNKSELGKCFVNDCCTWAEREPDDICGLDINRLGYVIKRKTLVEKSSLKKSFSKVGLL